MGLVDLKSKLNEFKGVNTPENPYDRNKPTQLSDSVKSSGRSGGVRPSIRTFAKGLEMFGIGSVPIGDTYEDKIKQDSIFTGNDTLNSLNKGISAFKSIKKSVKSFSDNPLKSISDLANVDQEAKLIEYRAKAYGRQKKLGNPAAKIVITDRKVANSFEGPIKGGKKSRNVNQANMTPYGEKGKDTDLIDFYFKDIYNDKYIRFSALLSGITDTITPEYASERYLGRPESVYIYQGVSRALSFTFDVYPTTRQELPVLWEKVNYLVGMCYPNWVSLGKNPVAQDTLGAEPITMQSPLTEMTIGDLYRDTPGYLSSVGITVQDGSTWEFEDNLQLPHHIQIACEFVYIGKYLPNAKGKHFELNWLTDANDKLGTYELGTEDVYDGDTGTISNSNIGYVNRNDKYDWINPELKRNKDATAAQAAQDKARNDKATQTPSEDS